MQHKRSDILNAISTGDVIYGIAGGGREKLLLVYRTTRETIFARHVTSGAKAEFRRDGHSKRCDGGGNCTIISVGPLPTEDHVVAVGLDRKLRSAKALTDLKLSSDEIQLLQTYGELFRARPLPEA